MYNPKNQVPMGNPSLLKLLGVDNLVGYPKKGVEM
jgi:hypothetical protein